MKSFQYLENKSYIFRILIFELMPSLYTDHGKGLLVVLPLSLLRRNRQGKMQKSEIQNLKIYLLGNRKNGKIEIFQCLKRGI